MVKKGKQPLLSNRSTQFHLSDNQHFMKKFNLLNPPFSCALSDALDRPVGGGGAHVLFEGRVVNRPAQCGFRAVCLRVHADGAYMVFTYALLHGLATAR